MPVDTDAEVRGLRTVLRDLVALFAIPAAWVGREPSAVAAGLADALIESLQLDFAYVRLSDPNGAGAIDVTRGNAWRTFPEWLERHLAKSGQLSGKEIVPDVDGGAEPCRGVVIPIGVNGTGGVVAAACDRPDFPTEVDQLLLSLAANHAATAFQSARLVYERRRAEEELRKARDELEVDVAERTAELRRSEAYLAEAQRLTHTGSFAIDTSTQEVTHSSDEHLRLYGFEPEQGAPALSEFVQRIHPQDRAMYTEAIERGIREATNIEVEYRVVLPQGPVRRHREIATPVFNALGELDEFVGTVVDVTERRQAETELERLAGEQAALRRVATLVAREASQAEVFTAIASEIGHLFGVEEIRMVRYDEDSTGVVVARSGPTEDFFPVGSRVSVDADTAASRVLRTGEPVRIDDYGTKSGAIAEAVRSMGICGVVATPISVEGRLWGAIAAGTTHDEPLPPETESRLGQFTELMATAVANTEARAEAERLAEEQVALRRVATLVARGASPTAVFDAVAAEMEGLLGADGVTLSRYEADEEVTVVAHCGSNASRVPPGTRVSHQGENVTSLVRRSERPARMEHYEGTHGAIAELARSLGVRASVAAPIVVDGRLWGVTIANWRGEELPPPDTEERMAQFSELLDTAIANADSRDQLTASRVRLLTAGDEARRRVVRDLHDGAQQRLVHTMVTLKLAQRALLENDREAESLIGEALEHADKANHELRDLAHGILPAVLTRGGLHAAVEELTKRLALPVTVDVSTQRFSPAIEATAYFLVSEALTNAVKHSGAQAAEVSATVDGSVLRVEVRDDGVGGADPGKGSGLTGLRDRVEALGGRTKIDSPAGGGTSLVARIPIEGG